MPEIFEPSELADFNLDAHYVRSLDNARSSYAHDLSFWGGTLLEDINTRPKRDEYIATCVEGSQLIEDTTLMEPMDARAHFARVEAHNRAQAINAEFNGVENFVVKGLGPAGIGGFLTFAAFAPPNWPDALEAVAALFGPVFLSGGFNHMRNGVNQIDQQPVDTVGAFRNHATFENTLKAQILMEEDKLRDIFITSERSRRVGSSIGAATLLARLILGNKLPY